MIFIRPIQLDYKKFRGTRYDEFKISISLMIIIVYTVKPAHAITSVKQSPVLEGHHFLVLSQKFSYELNLF